MCGCFGGTVIDSMLGGPDPTRAADKTVAEGSAGPYSLQVQLTGPFPAGTMLDWWTVDDTATSPMVTMTRLPKGA